MLGEAGVQFDRPNAEVVADGHGVIDFALGHSG
jgi:hypothetical protein